MFGARGVAKEVLGKVRDNHQKIRGIQNEVASVNLQPAEVRFGGLGHVLPGIRMISWRPGKVIRLTDGSVRRWERRATDNSMSLLDYAHNVFAFYEGVRTSNELHAPRGRIDDYVYSWKLLGGLLGHYSLEELCLPTIPLTEEARAVGVEDLSDLQELLSNPKMALQRAGVNYNGTPYDWGQKTLLPV